MPLGKEPRVIKSKRLRHWLNYNPDIDDDDEVNDEPSLTVPDQAMTVQTIMARHLQGRPIPMSQNLTYTTDNPEDAPDLPDVRKLDLTEQQELMYDTYHNITEGQKKLAEQKRRRNSKAPGEQAKKDEAKQSGDKDDKPTPDADK